MAWNTWRHMEAWYGILGLGAVYHTLNPRLFPDQIAWIMNDAEDRMLFVDLTFLPCGGSNCRQGTQPRKGHRSDGRGAYAGDKTDQCGGL